MQKVIRINNKDIVILNNGCKFEKDDITDEEFEIICNSSDEELMKMFNPQYEKDLEEAESVKKVINSVESSNLLIKKGDSIYFKGVSELSLPKELVEAIITAENNNDELKLEAYRNFWTLMSLNPNEELMMMFNPQYEKDLEEVENVKKVINSVESSNLVSKK